VANALRFNVAETEHITDPTTGSGDVAIFPDGFGQNGHPFVLHVQDPPNKTRPRHSHHADVIYVYTQGEHQIEGEGTYRAGDVRWTRAGHAYGPETTGPDGGAWWIFSYGDPIPVDTPEEKTNSQISVTSGKTTPAGELPKFNAPFRWAEVDEAIATVGGAILSGLGVADLVSRLNAELNIWLNDRPDAGKPESGSDAYNFFLGKRTLRLHGLISKLPSAGELIALDDIVGVAERATAPYASSVLLNAAELIQIGPGEPAQFLHRDTDSWPNLPTNGAPALINAIFAFDPFTLENGATYIVPASHNWESHRTPTQEEMVRAVMGRGDVLLFRGDLIHGGGENTTSLPRRAISVSYCAGWLRPVENSYLNVPKEVVKNLPERLQALLGYAMHNATAQRGGMLGLYEGGDPRRALRDV
tara:strand:- start:624 stop:1871 length:1248 start_codon:yes stop_codon:yes gene_type:complete